MWLFGLSENRLVDKTVEVGYLLGVEEHVQQNVINVVKLYCDTRGIGYNVPSAGPVTLLTCHIAASSPYAPPEQRTGHPTLVTRPRTDTSSFGQNVLDTQARGDAKPEHPVIRHTTHSLRLE